MKLENILKEYGLSEKQAKVYLTCLGLNSSSVQKISGASELPRTTCYEVLTSLKSLGLISSFQKKKVHYFTAVDPHKIINAAEEKARLLQEALPEFLSLYDQYKTRPTVRFYEGKKAMKMILDEILSEAKELFAFSSTDDLDNILGEDFQNYVKQRAKKKIPSKVIMRDTPLAKVRQQTGIGELREVRIIPHSYEHHSLIYIWGNKVAMFSLQKDLNVLVTESQELAQFHKTTFDYIWNTLPSGYKRVSSN